MAQDDKQPAADPLKDPAPGLLARLLARFKSKAPEPAPELADEITDTLTTGSLCDLYEKIRRESASGVLRVDTREGARYFEFKDGAATIAGRAADCPDIGDLLLARDMIDAAKLHQARALPQDRYLSLGENLLNMHRVSRANMEEALRFHVHDELSALFGLASGEFRFIPDAVLDAGKTIAQGIYKIRLDLSPVLAEAAQTEDSWARVARRVPSQLMVFKLTQAGAFALASGGDVSKRRLLLLKAVHQRGTIELLTQKTCLGRLQTNDLLLDLCDDNLVEPMTPEEYLKLAQDRLGENWFSEAERVAWCVKSCEQPGLVAAAETILSECNAQRRKAEEAAAQQHACGFVSLRQTQTSVSTRAVVQSQSNAPRSLRKKALATLAVLAALGLLGYKLIAPAPPPKRKIDTLPADALAMLEQSSELARQKNFGEALRIAREFSPVNALSREAADKHLRQLVTEIETSLRAANDLAAAAPEPEKDARLDELKRFEAATSLTSAGEAQLNRAAALIRKRHEEKRFSALRLRADELLWKRAGLSDDELARQCAELLKDAPPEKIAREFRDTLSLLDARRREAAAQLDIGSRALQAGDFDTAREACGKAADAFKGGPLAESAAAGLRSIDDKNRQAAAEFERIEALLIQKQTVEAARALKEFLQSAPPKLLTEKARAKLAELGEKSEPSALARRRMSAASDPADAEVIVGNRIAGKTPCDIEVPLLGPVRITFRKPGFSPCEFFARDMRDHPGDTIHGTLDRKAEYTRLPAPASGGIGFFGDKLALCGGNEITLYDVTDRAVLRRIKLTQPGPARFSIPKESVARPGTLQVLDNMALVAADDDLLFQIQLDGDAAKSVKAPAPVIGRGILLKFGEQAVWAVPTRAGYAARDPHSLAPLAVYSLCFDAASLAMWGGGDPLDFYARNRAAPPPGSITGAPLLPPVMSSAAATSGKILLIAVEDQKQFRLRAFSPAGKPLWQCRLEAAPVALAARDGRVYIALENSVLMLIDDTAR
jgi:hypothetical protein